VGFWSELKKKKERSVLSSASFCGDFLRQSQQQKMQVPQVMHDLRLKMYNFTIHHATQGKINVFAKKKKMISRVQKQSKLRYNHSNYSQVIDLTALSFNARVELNGKR